MTLECIKNRVVFEKKLADMEDCEPSKYKKSVTWIMIFCSRCEDADIVIVVLWSVNTVKGVRRKNQGAPVMVFGCVSSEGDIMLSYIFKQGFRIYSDGNVKLL